MEGALSVSIGQDVWNPGFAQPPTPGPSVLAGLVFFLPDHESKTGSEEML